MAVAVQLVPPLEVRVAALAAAMPEARVEVPVLLLRRRHLLGDRRDQPVELGRAAAADLPGEPLDHLVDIGVGELAPRLGMRVAEVVDPPEPRLPAVAVRQQRRGVELLAPAPEAALEADVVDRAQNA